MKRMDNARIFVSVGEKGGEQGEFGCAQESAIRSVLRGFHGERISARRAELGLCPKPRGGYPCDPAPFPFSSMFQNGPRRQGFASPRKSGAPLTAPGRSEQRP